MTELAQINEHSTEIGNLENQTETISSFSCPKPEAIYLPVQYSSDTSIHVNMFQTRSTEIRKRISLNKRFSKTRFFVELISMYELAYCSWCIVVSTASTKG